VLCEILISLTFSTQTKMDVLGFATESIRVNNTRKQVPCLLTCPQVLINSFGDLPKRCKNYLLESANLLSTVIYETLSARL